MSEETTEPKRGRQVKKEEKHNIDPEKLAAFRSEFINGTRDGKGRKVPMSERKLIALRNELVRLFEAGKIAPSEQDFMEAILRKDRASGKIFTSHEYLLNKIEYDRCTETCVVKSSDVPLVHHMHKGLACRFIYDPEFNDGKGKPDSLGRYNVYIPRIVPTRHQLSISVVEREQLGHPVDPSEYPAPRTLINRVVLKEREFEAWLEINSENPLDDLSFLDGDEVEI